MFFSIVAFVFLAMITGSASESVEPTFLKASNDFSMEIYSKIVEGNTGSIIFSPASIQQVLTMLSFGAVGTTKDQLMAGLKYPEDFTSEDVERNCEILNDNVKNSPFLKMANRIFVKIGVKVQPNYDELTKRVFGSETQALDFKNPSQAAKIINEWIELQTNGKIKNALGPEYLSESTNMVLVNAIYFMGNWEYKFDPKSTRKDVFYNAENSNGKSETTLVDTMFLMENLNYTALPDLDAAALRLPYKNSDISMMIIRPNKLAGLPLIEEGLKTTAFEDIVKSLKLFPVLLFLPKFKIESEIELDNALKAMGMEEMFTSKANFSALLAGNENYQISKVLHKAVIEVNEVGTEAAATTIGVMPTSSDSRQKLFVVNRPFFYAIYNNDGIYFSGRVTKF